VSIAGDGIPDNKALTSVPNVDEDAPVVGTHGPPIFAIELRLRQGGFNCGGDEAGQQADVGVRMVVEEAEERRRTVELAVAAEERGVGEDAAPALVDEGGAQQVRGLVRRDAEEDLRDGVLHQLRQGHDALVGGEARVRVGDRKIWGVLPSKRGIDSFINDFWPT
jgi:hypothetical protein